MHRGRPFYESWSPSCRADPASRWRSSVPERWPPSATIGATDPAEAAAGTIRKLAESKGRNAVHGSDSDENAARESGSSSQRLNGRSGESGQ